MKIYILSLLLLSKSVLADVNFVDRIGIIVEEGIIMESEVNNALEQAIKNLKKIIIKSHLKNFFSTTFLKN